MPTYIKKPEYIIAHQFDWTKSGAMNIMKEFPDLLSLGSSYNASNDEFTNWCIEAYMYSRTLVNKWDYIFKADQKWYYVLPEKEFLELYDTYISSQ